VLSDSIADTVHDAKLQVTASIIPEAQDNDGVDDRDLPATQRQRQALARRADGLSAGAPLG